MIVYVILWLTPDPSQGNKEDTTTLHVLGLLKELLGTFPLGAVKSCCETLLRVMTLSHVVRTYAYSQVQPQTHCLAVWLIKSHFFKGPISYPSSDLSFSSHTPVEQSHMITYPKNSDSLLW